ncbi:MAG: hypothetical protein JWP01_3652 [Myxococcales bacterium]|nr:hypothetical protein [Myxococcales bacterium]
MTTSRIRRFLALGLCAIGAAVVLSGGCKQGEGERCQAREDCESPLVCNLATLTCSNESSTGQIDATVQDGPPADAAVDAIDAASDAAIDAI